MAQRPHSREPLFTSGSDTLWRRMAGPPRFPLEILPPKESCESTLSLQSFVSITAFNWNIQLPSNYPSPLPKALMNQITTAPLLAENILSGESQRQGGHQGDGTVRSCSSPMSHHNYSDKFNRSNALSTPCHLLVSDLVP